MSLKTAGRRRRQGLGETVVPDILDHNARRVSRVVIRRTHILILQRRQIRRWLRHFRCVANQHDMRNVVGWHPSLATGHTQFCENIEEAANTKRLAAGARFYGGAAL